MSCRISYILMVTLWLSGFINAARDSHSSWNHGKESAGSGGWDMNLSDDEDLMDSGSGSGSGFGEIDIQVEKNKSSYLTSTTTASFRTSDHPQTNCEKMRHSQSLSKKYPPRCLPNGDFDFLQCLGNPGTSECWCSDLQGKEIPGTLMEAPNFPSCDDGNNLPPCVHQLVKNIRHKLLGSFRPSCAPDGQFDLVQCKGSLCFCVDESTGRQVFGTEVHLPGKPKCGGGSAGAEATDDIIKKSDPKKDTTEGNIDIDAVIDHRPIPTAVDVDKSQETKKGQDKFPEDNKSKTDEKQVISKSGQEAHENKVEKASEIMTQPGILAGIIGGSVVLLLCLVLLAMFIIYRMRKKDEGSYPLDEPRKTPNYNYVRAPEKEFYA